MKKMIAVLVVAVALLAGCGPTRQQQVAQGNAQLQAWVGAKDYDYFVTQLGPPASQADTGDFLVARWEINNTMYITTTNFAVPIHSGERLTAKFSKQSRLLVSGQFEKW